ncbi:hypothetical protein [Flavonifractor plautii]|jgi:hypothetical protein|uniref:Uncharacterized protein n=1 Tax=Flavonifractor plautii TaxID=292800 RepID=A0A6I2R1Z7_FLAPL|nr:hypothetical protein [Flavonifractor plautii]MDB7956292.1 hypothetical protein [Flavonifractor plautii]MSB19929.1 hypothetical protein [Flavonifractor plautii]MSB83555.1 hypothetical protein [Flavonifractor plautii]
MNARLLTAMETEQALANLLSDLKALISGEINETPPLDGVTPLNGSPRCAVVSSRSIMESLRFNMSPRYYLQGAQADAVNSAVASCKTVTELIERLHGMEETQKVSHGEDAGTVLNERTLAVIREFIA